MMDDYISLVEENAILEHELNTILDIVFDAIETESYINPFGIISYLKAIYPDRYLNKLKKIYAQND